MLLYCYGNFEPYLLVTYLKTMPEVLLIVFEYTFSKINTQLTIDKNLPWERVQVVFPKKNLQNYQTITQTFLRNQVQHSAMENTVY